MFKLIGLFSLFFINAQAIAGGMCVCGFQGSGSALTCTAPTGWSLRQPNGTSLTSPQNYKNGCYTAQGTPAAVGEIGTHWRYHTHQYFPTPTFPAGYTNPQALVYCKGSNDTRVTPPWPQDLYPNAGMATKSCTGTVGSLALRGCVGGNSQANGIGCIYCNKSTGQQPNGATAIMNWSCEGESNLTYNDGCYDAAGALVKTGGTHLRTYSCSAAAGYTMVKKCGTSFSLIYEKKTPCQYGCANGACKTSPSIQPASGT